MESSDDSYESESDLEEEPVRNIGGEADQIKQNLLPTKSCKRYQICYDKFITWMKKNKITQFTEDAFLVYFSEESKKLKPSTLWGEWSMLRSVMSLFHNVNLKVYDQLKAFVKKQSRGYRPKKSKVFSWEQMKKFLEVAPDPIFLAMKVILIFGICGALRSIEFCNIHTSDIEDTGSKYIISIPETKTYIPRSFVIASPLYNVVQKYAALRPDNTPTDRFFLNYQNGTCRRQVIGKNKFSNTPKLIATFLKLPEPENFTGHAFRRTSATLVANAEPNITILMQHGGWASEKVARGYCESSVKTKERIFQHIVSGSEPIQNPYSPPMNGNFHSLPPNGNPHLLPIHSNHHSLSTSTSSSEPLHQGENNSPSHVPPDTYNSNDSALPPPNATLRPASTSNADSSIDKSFWEDNSDNEALETFNSIFLQKSNSATLSPNAENCHPSNSHLRRPLASMENVQSSTSLPTHSKAVNPSLKRPAEVLENSHGGQQYKQQRQSHRERVSTEETANRITADMSFTNPDLVIKNCTITNVTINNYYYEPKNATTRTPQI